MPPFFRLDYVYPSRIAEAGLAIPQDSFEKQSFPNSLSRYISLGVCVPPLHWTLCEVNLVWKFTWTEQGEEQSFLLLR